jgi:hypothetical protein
MSGVESGVGVVWETDVGEKTEENMSASDNIVDSGLTRGEVEWAGYGLRNCNVIVSRNNCTRIMSLKFNSRKST